MEATNPFLRSFSQKEPLRIRDDESTKNKDRMIQIRDTLEGHLHSIKLIVLFCGDIKPLKNQKDSINGFLKRNRKKFTDVLFRARAKKVEQAFDESPSFTEMFDSDFVFDYIDFARKDGSDELMSFMNLADPLFNLRRLEMELRGTADKFQSYETGADILYHVMSEVARCVECKEGSALAESLAKYIMSNTRSKDFDEIVNDVYREFGKAFSASLTLF